MQGPANAIAAGKRPLSSMTPTIVLEAGKLRFVLGSPGGSRIITTVANIFLSATEGGLNIQQAVDAPRFHHQYLPDKLYLEPASAETLMACAREATTWKSRTATGQTASALPSTQRLANCLEGKTTEAITGRPPAIEKFVEGKRREKLSSWQRLTLVTEPLELSAQVRSLRPRL